MRGEEEVDLATVATIALAHASPLATALHPVRVEPAVAAALFAVFYPLALAGVSILGFTALTQPEKRAARYALVALAAAPLAWLALSRLFLPEAEWRFGGMIKCGDPEECRLLVEEMRAVVGQSLDAILAALAALTLVSVALNLLHRRKNPGGGAEHRALAA